MPKHLISLPSGAVLPAVTGLPEGYPFVQAGKLYALLDGEFALVGGAAAGGGSSLDLGGLPLYNFQDTFKKGSDASYAGGLETYSGTLVAPTVNRSSWGVFISVDPGGSGPFGTDSAGGVLVTAGGTALKSNPARGQASGTVANEQSYSADFTRTFGQDMIASFQTKLRKQNASTTGRLRVFLDGVEVPTLAKTNLDETAWGAVQTLPVPAGTHTIRFTVDDPGTATNGQTTYMELSGVVYAPAEEPADAATFLNVDDLYVYDGTAFLPIGLSTTDDETTFYNNGHKFGYSPETLAIGHRVHQDSDDTNMDVIIGWGSRAIYNRDPAGYTGYSVTVGGGAQAVGEAVAIGGETWVGARSGIGIGPFCYIDGRDDIGIGAYVETGVARDGTRLDGPSTTTVVSTTGGTLKRTQKPFYVVTARDTTGGESGAGIGIGPFTLTTDTSSVAITITNQADATDYIVYRRSTEDVKDPHWYKIGEIPKSGGATTVFTDTGLPDTRLTRNWVNTTGGARNAKRTIIGPSASSSGNALFGVALGFAASVSGDDATALGTASTAGHNRSTAVGVDAQTTKANQVVLGTATERVTVPGAGIELVSPNGTVYLLSVSDAGNAVFTLVP